MSIVQPAPDSNGRSDPNGRKAARRPLRIIAWIAGCLVLLVLAAIIGIVALVNSDGVHRYLLGLAQKQASQKLGVQVQLQNFTLHLSSLGLDLYGITVHGASPYSDPPLLEADHIEVSARIISIFGGKWYLDTLRIDHPVAWIFIDKNGNSNIPRLQSSGNKSNNNEIFNLGIRHALLDRGEVYFNSRPSTLAADLHNVDFRASFNSLLDRYSGRLAYTNAHLQYGAIQPITHNLAIQFDATPSTFHLERANVECGSSQVTLSGTVQNYSDPAVQAQYNAKLDGNQIGQIFKISSMPVGTIQAAGSVQYHQASGQTLLQALVVNGSIASRKLNVKTASARVEMDNIAAHYSLVNGDATLRDLRATLLGGQLTAKGAMNNIGGNSHSSLNAALRNVSLSQLRQMASRSTSPSNLALTGSLNATASASWGKTLDTLTAHADSTVNGQVARVNGPGEQHRGASVPNGTSAPANLSSISLESALHATYSAKSKQFALNNSYLRTPQTNLSMNGVVGRNSSLAFTLQANDLHEVAAMVDLFRAPASGQSLQPLDLAGKATFQGNVQGSTTAPHLTGQLTATNLHYNGMDWKVVRTGVDLSSNHAALQHADLESASRGRIALDASVALTKWSFARQNPIQVQLNAAQINLAELTKLSGRQIPITGTLNVNLALHGTMLNPAGHGNLSLTNVTAYEQPVQSANVSFSGDGNTAHADVSMRLPAGDLRGNVTVQPNQRTYSAEFASTGMQLDKLEAIKARNLNVTGVLAFHANGQGSFDNPQLNASLQIPTLVVESQTISDFKLQMNLANHIANMMLTSSTTGVSIQAKAAIHLGDDYMTDASVDTKAFPLEPLLAAYAPSEAANISGQTEVHATLHGPLKKPKLMEAHVTIPVLKLGYTSNIQLAATAPIQVDYRNGVVNLQPASIRGTDTDLQLQAAVPVAGTGAMSLRAQGTINLHLAQLFDPDLRSSGELKLNIDSHGPIGGGNLGGEIDIVDANFSSADLPVGMQHGNGVLRLTANRLNIEKFEGTIGGGTVTAQGGLAYRPKLEFDMGLAAKGIRILYPQGMRESVDANIRLTGAYSHALLGGSVNLSDLSFTPGFDLTTFVRQFSGGVAAPAAQGFSQNLALNIAVRSTNNVNLVSRTLSINGSANLQVRGTAAEPVILGRVNLTGGDIIMNGDHFFLTGGTVQFVNPSETQPVVNLTLTTSIQQYNINLRFNGPAEQLHTDYSSNPALPTADIINLLAFGETTEASAQNTMSTNQQAESLVASQVSSQVTSRISKVAGISQLSISPVLANSSSQGPPGANITIQQRVTGNLFVTFSTNVASTQSQTIQGQYKVSPRVSVSATRDPNGGFAVDTLINKSW